MFWNHFLIKRNESKPSQPTHDQAKWTGLNETSCYLSLLTSPTSHFGFSVLHDEVFYTGINYAFFSMVTYIAQDFKAQKSLKPFWRQEHLCELPPAVWVIVWIIPSSTAWLASRTEDPGENDTTPVLSQLVNSLVHRTHAPSLHWAGKWWLSTWEDIWGAF